MDLYIRNGIIEEMGRNLNKQCDVIDGRGYLLLPAFIDTHAHFRDPGLTYKEDSVTGSRAAVKGGFTAVNLMANTKPVCSTMETVNYVMKKAEETGLVDVHQAVSITKDFNGKDIDHLDVLNDDVKLISEDGRDVASSEVMLDAMLKAKEKGLIVMSHVEDEKLVKIDTRLSENVMTIRNIELAKYAKCKFHLAHVSTKEAMKMVIDSKKEGYSITCEVTPHHIALTSDIQYRVNPSLREKEDVDFIINAIKNGYVDTIGTDHAPHSVEDKQNGAPGLSGIETAFSVCYTALVKAGHISLNKLSEIMSKNAAKLLGFNKGEIKIGMDGDLVLIDISQKYKISSDNFVSKGKNTPFEGFEVWGKVIKTIKKGKVVYSED
ncbi:MAG: dihydroorotase [Bacillota bacterium]|nr:dihydroorotase [Bacillota bacterium]